MTWYITFLDRKPGSPGSPGSRMITHSIIFSYLLGSNFFMRKTDVGIQKIGSLPPLLVALLLNSYPLFIAYFSNVQITVCKIFKKNAAVSLGLMHREIAPRWEIWTRDFQVETPSPLCGRSIVILHFCPHFALNCWGYLPFVGVETWTRLGGYHYWKGDIGVKKSDRQNGHTIQLTLTSMLSSFLMHRILFASWVFG